HYTSKFTPFELIKTSCNFFGSSYEGRRRNEIQKKNILSKGCLYFTFI
ncbi:competence protein ComK, partial [Listeria monocytogenes]|nr:competence protein ComK [Listeria monocytogenes]EKR1335462.1 competence protein ComK [Listeria monocytogenes]